MFDITTLKAAVRAGEFVLERCRLPPRRASGLGLAAPHSGCGQFARVLVAAAVLFGAVCPVWAEPAREDPAARAETVAVEQEQAATGEQGGPVEQPAPAPAKVATIEEGEGPSPVGRGKLPNATVGYAQIVAALDREAGRLGLPPEIAEAVTHTESRFNQAAIGDDGEIGLMQVLPSTARMMGFKGSLSELAIPETNIRYGVSYLAQAWRLARGDLCTAVMKYRAGHGETRFSHLSVDYCLKVRSRLSSRGFLVTGSVPLATFGNPVGSPRIGGGGGRCRGKCLAGSQGGADLAALNAKLNQLIVKVSVLKVPTR